MAEAPKQKPYHLNTHIRDLTPDELKEYAALNNMSMVEALNTAIWYCYANGIDLAIWRLKEVRKAQDAE